MRNSASVIVFLGLFACGRPAENEKTAAPEWAPPPGSMIAADSMRVSEEVLNKFWFSVRINAGDAQSSRGGDYNIHAGFGNAVADGQFSMPRGGEHLRPILRRDTGYSFVIGFIPGAAFGGDTIFHAYYRVSGSRREIKIAAVNAFHIQ